jgi:hypothetical protein
MLKKSSFSHKVLPVQRRVVKPAVPSIKIFPKINTGAKIIPEISESTTSNSKSTSFIAQNRTGKRKSTSGRRPKDFIEISDILCLEEYKKNEILRSHKMHNSKYPYWYINNFRDLEMTRSLRQTQFFSDVSNKSNNPGFTTWANVSCT